LGKRAVSIGTLWGLVFLFSVCVFAADPTISHAYAERLGFTELLVTTPLGNYVFSEDGGTLRSVLLTFAPYGSSVAELVAGTTTNASTLARAYLAGGEFPFELQEGGMPSEYTLREPVYTETGAVVVELHGENSAWTVVKQFTIEPDAMYTLSAEIRIVSESAQTEPVRMVLSNYTPTAKGRQLTYLYDDEPAVAQLAPGSFFQFQGIGLMDGEVALVLSPRQGTSVLPFAELTDAGTRRIGVLLDVASGDAAFEFSLYGGRRRFITMEAAGIEALDQTGVFARLMVYIIRFLEWLYQRTGNYGWAIILFTLLSRILLFPLMRKQYHSMARMQQIQPLLKRVQAKYKDNREEMQRKILEIYRKEKVNPMSGCFPMALQLPLIVLIWRALLYAAELIHLSPGFLWIPDLSLHDPYYILVVLTTAIMLLQQYFMAPMAPTESAGPQKYMGYFFPILMAFLLWRFPAGLWLYYLLTTAAQVGQQAFVNWEMARAGGGAVGLPNGEIAPGQTSESETDDGEST
jgi:YidC/Oxa1 family membrane protein insertase